MKLIIHISQDGKHSKCTTFTPKNRVASELREMVLSPEKREQDKKKMAISLVSMAMGLHGEPEKLFAHFNLKLNRK